MTRACTALGVLLLLPAVAAAAPARPAPPLPAPAGAVVYVSSESQLRTAASRLASNTTIAVTPGVYVLQDTICINGTFTNVGIRGSSGTTAEGNTFIDCQREIAFGLIERTPDDHTGGVIRNNFIYRQPSVAGDAAIGVFNSPNTQVLHNTILGSGTYLSLIEYRFPRSAGVQIANNLLDGRILARDGASGTLSGNVTTAAAALFVNPSAGDLHLAPTATSLFDRVAVLANAATDWDGQSRPRCAAADAGADEYVPSALPSTPNNLRIVP